MKKVIIATTLLSVALSQHIIATTDYSPAGPVYFCTAANSSYFRPLINFIGSVHRYHHHNLGEIAIFDIGLNAKEIAIINAIEKTKIYTLEKKNPHILKPIPKYPSSKLYKIGSYSFKPVAIKQMLDKVPDFLWCDAGTTLLKTIDPLFQHIREQGYFLQNACPFSVSGTICKPVIENFNLNTPENSWVLSPDLLGICSGVMGVTEQVRNTFVMPAYDAASDINNFINNGTATAGKGYGLQDQSVFSVITLLAKLHVHQHNAEHEFDLKVGNHTQKFGLSFLGYIGGRKPIFDISCSRFLCPFYQVNCNSIQWKSTQTKQQFLPFVTKLPPHGKQQKGSKPKPKVARNKKQVKK